jgi:hypothetical protein
LKKANIVINSIPSIHANTVIPFASLGRQVVGQEFPDLKASTFKAVEPLASSAHGENRHPQEGGANASPQDSAAPEKRQVGSALSGKANQVKERQQINALVKIDREVHMHEQAHSAAGGTYAGSPVYQFVKGPNGVSYAVEGEVPIDTSPIPDDPEATIRKAQQIRQAANAPAEPSAQDRRIAAIAASVEAQAQAELAAQKNAEIKIEIQKAEQKAAMKKEEGEARANEEAQRDKEIASDDSLRRTRFEESSHARAELFEKTSKSTFDIGRHLVEIGVVKGGASAGTLFNSKV